jgi:hypothetical protein
MDLITTIGGNTSNSMITVEEADAYIADSPYPQTAWDGLTDDEKILRLVLAAKFMVNRFSWIGVTLYENQAMPFPRYVPPRRFQKGAWPLGATGGVSVNGVFYPMQWEGIYEFGQLSVEQLAELETIPDDIKRAQAYIAYGVIHRGMVGITDPATGPKAKAQLKSLSLFESLSLTVATTPVQLAGSTQFDLATSSEHFIISMLIDDWITQISWGYGTKIVSPLPEVESGTSPSL